MTEQIDRQKLKHWARDMVAQVEPDDVFVVEEGFDSLLEAWHAAVAQDEGRFAGGAEAATFAGIIVPFLFGFFGDVAKDVVKDQAKKAVGKLIDKLLDRKASDDDASRLRDEIEAAISKSRFSTQQKETLRAGFGNLFAKLGAPT